MLFRKFFPKYLVSAAIFSLSALMLISCSANLKPEPEESSYTLDNEILPNESIETLTQTTVTTTTTTTTTTTAVVTTTSSPTITTLTTTMTSSTTATTTTVISEDTTITSADDYSEVDVNSFESIEEPELTEPFEPDFNEIWNGIIINGQIIQTVIAPTIQENVDSYDVVQDVDLWSRENNIYLLGHVTKSFSILIDVSVDDVITLVNDGIPHDYIVRRSELCQANERNTNIFSCETGESLFFDDFGYENTLRLVTCVLDMPPSYRWLVICERLD